MTRDTDTPSSGPHGRGGAAYPSGTPPYGTPVSDDGADAGRPAARPEDRKTETTLTTRVRINIPGSRPIPPVVVRKPVPEGETEASGGAGSQGRDSAGRPEGTGRTDATGGGVPGDTRSPGGAAAASASASAPAPGGAAQTPGGEPAASGEDKPTSDWFAPRKSAPGKGGQPGGGTNGAGLPGGSGTPANGTGSGAGAGSGAAPAGGRPGGVVGSMSVPPATSRNGSGNGTGLPGATGGPVAPGHGGGTGSFDVTEALAAGPLSGGSRPGGGEPRRDDLPYFAEGGQNGPEGHGGYGDQGGPGGFDGAGLPGGPAGSPGPAGPTGGPVTGDAALFPPTTGGPAEARRGVPGAPAGHPGTPGTPAPSGHTARPGGGLSDDTAILTPQKLAPELGGPGSAHRPDNVSGHTVTSGMPVLPTGAGDADSPFRTSPGGSGPQSPTPPKLPDPAPQSAGAPAKSAKSAKAPKKKGRSKIALLGGLVVVAAGLAYGAGLLMNHSDVPKGTTVLGVDIGGGSRDDAVKKLDDAFGKQVNKPLKLSVDGSTVALKPEQAGLQLDTQATASAAAQSDYNPVSVIGSLFGNHRVVQPQMPVDEEKLQAALQNAAGGAGAATDGTIKFEPGKAVAVYGKAGKGIDAARSTEAVEQAYRTQVETGTSRPVQVPTTTRRPTVSDAEVDRMMKKFAEPAMSGFVTVRVDAAHSVRFGPQKSLWKFLGVKAVDGKLVEYYDQAALKQLYGGAFDKVLITRGTGQKTPVTVEDVIGALRPALMSRTDRVGVIDTDPS
ncbi:hypothetical protein ABZ858_15430 [Streptomyces sp. NPDC047017]|uniref:hypothetical protein n=1 Tax=Streptomyces sp. NPDC047017 TaxID=3155024 RepID=UPI003407920F